MLDLWISFSFYGIDGRNKLCFSFTLIAVDTFFFLSIFPVAINWFFLHEYYLCFSLLLKWLISHRDYQCVSCEIQMASSLFSNLLHSKWIFLDLSLNFHGLEKSKTFLTIKSSSQKYSHGQSFYRHCICFTLFYLAPSGL